MLDDRGENKKHKRGFAASILLGLGSVGIAAACFYLHFRSPAGVDTKISPRAAPSRSVGLAIVGRRELLAVSRSAASTFAAAGELGEHNSLMRQRFSVRIAFGCVEDGNNGGQTNLTFAPDYRSALLEAAPRDWTSSLMIEGAAWKDTVKGVEGFWLPRAWTDSETCPPQANYVQPISPTPPTGQSVGLAQLFPKNGKPKARHAVAPYRFIRKLLADNPESKTRHYFLLLEGQITGFPDGRDLHCYMEGADHRPMCIFAVKFDNIAFEDGTTGKVLASWQS